jgi:hypothetical protein
MFVPYASLNIPGLSIQQIQQRKIMWNTADSQGAVNIYIWTARKEMTNNHLSLYLFCCASSNQSSPIFTFFPVSKMDYVMFMKL